MITNGRTTADSLSHIPDLIVVPKLFDEPDEGYIAWIQSQVPNPNPISPGTIPARILQAEGEGRYWGWLLPQIIMGTYERQLLDNQDPDDPAVQDILTTETVADLTYIAGLDDLPVALRRAAAAKLCRRRFDAGQPLYIGMWQNPNRYKTFVPVLTYEGNNQYQAGGRQNNSRFQAQSHDRALEMGWLWYQGQHEREIDEAKSAARKLPLPRMVIELLGAILEKDGAIYDGHGTRVAWKNGGIHGRFGVAAPTWCYIMKCAPQTAGMLMAVAHMEAAEYGVGDEWQLNIVGKVHEYLGLTVGADEDKPLTFAGGYLLRHPQHPNRYGVLFDGGHKPAVQVIYQPPPKEGRPARIQITDVPSPGRKPQLIGESAGPATWGLTRLDHLAWGVSVAVNYWKRKKK